MLKKQAEEKKKKNDEKMRRVLEAKKQQEIKDQAKKTNKVGYIILNISAFHYILLNIITKTL